MHQAACCRAVSRMPASNTPNARMLVTYQPAETAQWTDPPDREEIARLFKVWRWGATLEAVTPSHARSVLIRDGVAAEKASKAKRPAPVEHRSRTPRKQCDQCRPSTTKRAARTMPAASTRAT